MDYDTAIDILELDANCTSSEIKQAYRKKALKYHPDKNIGDNDSKEKFQKISEAYTYLSNNEKRFDINEKSNSGYNSLLRSFLSYFNKDIDIDLVLSIIEKLTSKSKVYIIELFNGCDKDTVVQIYEIIVKYKDIFQVDNDIVEDIERIVKEKTKNDNIIIINPTLDDLFKANIYKLERDNQEYYIPLWHDEVYFKDTATDNDLIIKCIPDIPDHIYIDEDNNIHINVIHRTTLNELLNKDHIRYVSYDKMEKEIISLNIPITNLFIKKHQLYKFSKLGIPKINSNEIYSIKQKSNIIIHLELKYN